MRYCHIGTLDNGTLVWAILVWEGGSELPTIRFAPAQNPQTQMLASHAPQAVASLIKGGYAYITIIGVVD